MGNRFVFRLLIALVAIGILAAVGVYGYNLGVAHALAQSSHPGGPGAWPPYGYWPHPWGFGFGFFPFFPLLFIFFWVLIFRALFWRGRWGRGWNYCNGGVPPAFEEWHRRAHAQPGSPAASGPNA
jgi:H+/Cl- antiporter ClcA